MADLESELASVKARAAAAVDRGTAAGVADGVERVDVPSVVHAWRAAVAEAEGGREEARAEAERWRAVAEERGSVAALAKDAEGKQASSTLAMLCCPPAAIAHTCRRSRPMRDAACLPCTQMRQLEELRDRCRRAEDARSALEAELRGALAKAAEAEAARAALEQRVAEAERAGAGSAELRAELESARQETASLRVRVADKAQRLETALEEVAARQRRVARLTDDLTAARERERRLAGQAEKRGKEVAELTTLVRGAGIEGTGISVSDSAAPPLLLVCSRIFVVHRLSDVVSVLPQLSAWERMRRSKDHHLDSLIQRQAGGGVAALSEPGEARGQVEGSSAVAAKRPPRAFMALGTEGPGVGKENLGEARGSGDAGKEPRASLMGLRSPLAPRDGNANAAQGGLSQACEGGQS